MNYEIPFLRRDIAGSQLSGEELTSRLAALSRVVETLTKEGWHVELTLTGVTCSPDCSVLYREGMLKDGKSPSEEDIQRYMRKKFADLGIDESFRLSASRKVSDVFREDVKHSNRVTYDEMERELRHGNLHPESDEKWNLVRDMERMERLYGRQHVLIPDSYERGVVHGRIQALRWVLGASWNDSAMPDHRDADLDPEFEGGIRVVDETDDKLEAFLPKVSVARKTPAKLQGKVKTKSKAQAKPKTKVKLKTPTKPKSSARSKAEVQPQSNAKPESNAAPNPSTNLKSQPIPKAKTKPSAGAKPKVKAKLVTQAVPRVNTKAGNPRKTAARPKTQATSEERPKPNPNVDAAPEQQNESQVVNVSSTT